MTSSAPLSSNVLSEMEWPETTSRSLKSGALVPKSSMVEGVAAIRNIPLDEVITCQLSVKWPCGHATRTGPERARGQSGRYHHCAVQRQADGRFQRNSSRGSETSH